MPTRPLVALLGESTTWGLLPTSESYAQALPTTAQALEALLAKVAPASPYCNAEVKAAAIPGLKTCWWLQHTAPASYHTWAAGFGDALAAHWATFAPFDVPLAYMLPWWFGSHTPDAWCVLMGVNDWMPVFEPVLTPEETVSNVAALVAFLKGGSPAFFQNRPVFLSPPIVPTTGPYSAHATAVRQLERDAGMMTGIDWPPFVLPDNCHPTGGGYASLAGLWLDKLCPQAGG